MPISSTFTANVNVIFTPILDPFHIHLLALSTPLISSGVYAPLGDGSNISGTPDWSLLTDAPRCLLLYFCDSPAHRIHASTSRLCGANILCIDDTDVSTVLNVHDTICDARLLLAPNIQVIFPFDAFVHTLNHACLPPLSFDHMRVNTMTDAYILCIHDTDVSTVLDVNDTICDARLLLAPNIQVTFTFEELVRTLTHAGLPYLSFDPMLVIQQPIAAIQQRIHTVTASSPCLTRHKLPHSNAWPKWQAAEHLPLDNYYAQAASPKTMSYMPIDAPLCDWWHKCFPDQTLLPGQAIPILETMQGHPEAPCQWSLHIAAILTIVCYLSPAKQLGITSTQVAHVTSLPSSPPPARSAFPSDVVNNHDIPALSDILFGYAASDWALDIRHCCSVLGIILMLADGAIAWLYRVPIPISLSTTASKVLSASAAGRFALSLRSVFDKLAQPKHHAPVLLAHHQAAILLSQASHPTRQTRPLEIREFTLLDWNIRHLTALEPIDTSMNASDMLIKHYPKVLFARHYDITSGKTFYYSLDHTSSLSASYYPMLEALGGVSLRLSDVRLSSSVARSS